MMTSLRSQQSSKLVLYGKEIEKMALELSKDDKPMEVRKTLAACYHELLANKKDFASFKRLDKLLENFVQDPMLKESGIQAMLSKNLTLIAQNYFARLEVTDLVNKILQRQRA